MSSFNPLWAPLMASRILVISVDAEGDRLSKTLAVVFVYRKEVGWPRQQWLALLQIEMCAVDT